METKFQGIPILPKVVPIAGFLEGPYGEDIFREAQDRALKKYENAKPLLVIEYKDGVVQGSNPFYTVLVNEILREGSQKLRTAAPADIERTLRAGDMLGIKGRHYVDTGLVLRSETDSYKRNDPLSRDLYNQLRKRVKLPVMIPLNGLDLKLDTNECGLGFNLREDAQLVHAPILNKPGRFNTEDIDQETGLPKETGKEGSRQLYTREDGLSRLGLDGGLVLGSGWYYVDGSGAGGRVALCGEAASNENLDGLIADQVKYLEQERNRQIEVATVRFNRALEVLKGKQ